jgi:hypothetical protein
MAEAIPVELRQTHSGWQLLRGGEPYFIRGAGGSASLQQLKDAGANSVRTWGAEDLDALLDEAHSLDLTVTVGIWLGHERHGFDYRDERQLKEQLQRVREAVQRYKNHPALLLWGVGNEMEGLESGDDARIWKAVNDAAALIKKLDPNHPTMTVTAEVGGGRIDGVHSNSPAIDIHGINSYGGATSLPERLRAGGATKPYVLTEFGPPGTWEIAATEWGAPLEPTSTQKAAFYKAAYERGVLGAKGQVLGAYAFTWGFKMEATATWYGMFLSDGSRLAAIDTMTQLWSGRDPENFAPDIQPLAVAGPVTVDPGSVVSVSALVTDKEQDEIRTHWALRPETGDYMTGGDFRPNLPDIEGAIIKSSNGAARVRMPDYPGPYRLFLVAHDTAGNAATANVPLLVKGEVRPRLPIDVYRDGLEGMPWAPSGWMGNIEALTLDGKHSENPQDGAASIKLRYEGSYGWAAVAWQNPANNWGDMDGGFDVSGATALELWARGEYGGEKVNFGVGLIEDDKPYPDSAKTNVEGIVLTREWQKYRVPLKKLDLSSIKSGFVVALTGRQTPVTIYLDSIRFVD